MKQYRIKYYKQMIAEKVMLYRCQIRNRNISKKMEKIRFLNWLQNYPAYDELLDNFLFLVARCKLEHKPQIQPLNQLINLIKTYNKDWNALILIWQQITQLNLISIICQKVNDRNTICQLIQSIIMNNQYQKLTNQDWKITIKQTQQLTTRCSYQQILTRMLIQLNKLLIDLNNWTSNHQLHRIFTILSYIASLDYMQEQAIGSIITSNCPKLSIFLSDYIVDNWSSLELQSIQHYLTIITFLQQNLENFQSKTDSQQYSLQINEKILHTILILLHNKPQVIQNKKTHYIMIKLMTTLNIDNSSHLKIISLIQNQQQIDGDSHILKLLCQISYKQEWLCYSHIQGFIMWMINRIEKQSDRISQKKQNIFTKAQIQFFNQGDQDTVKNRQNKIINLLINTIINQYNHHCNYDYYQIMEQIGQDLLKAGVLYKWCTHWRIAENMQYLMVRLLSVKKQKIRISMIQYAVNLFKYKHLCKNVRKKINLSIRLNGLDKYLQTIDGEDNKDESSNESNNSEEDVDNV